MTAFAPAGFSPLQVPLAGTSAFGRGLPPGGFFPPQKVAMPFGVVAGGGTSPGAPAYAGAQLIPQLTQQLGDATARLQAVVAQRFQPRGVPGGGVAAGGVPPVQPAASCMPSSGCGPEWPAAAPVGAAPASFGAAPVPVAPASLANPIVLGAGPQSAPGGGPAVPVAQPVMSRPDDAQLAQRIDAMVLAGTNLQGKGALIVEYCRKFRIPVDFVLAIYKKEAAFASPGSLAANNNNPGNLRFAEWERQYGGVPNGGFTRFPTMDDGIRASIDLLNHSHYRDAVDRRDWGAVINKWAPPVENDTGLYVRQMSEFSEQMQRTLGIDSNWVNT